MANVKHGLMSDFLVTFFVGDRAISKMLSDILRNRTNPLFLEALELPPDFTLPFFQEGSETSVVFLVKQGFNLSYEVFVNGEP